MTMMMVILVRDDVPLGFAMVAVAHASLAAYLRFRDTPEVTAWLAGPFFDASRRGRIASSNPPATTCPP